MSYFQISNGPGTDSAQPGDASGDILESLLAANIAAPAAERIASAFQAVYATQAALAASLRAALSTSRPQQQTGIDQQGQDKITADDRNRPDKPDLEVSGRATIGGDLNVGGNILANNLRVLNNAGVGRQIDAAAAAFRSLQIPGGARIANGVANIDAPLVANRPILARQGGQYAGENVFNGRVTLNGQVIWGGRVCDPANVVLIKTLNAGGNNRLRIGTGEVRVLRDHGNGPGGGLQFDYDPDQKEVLTAVTANTATETVNNYTLSNASATCVTAVQTAAIAAMVGVSSGTTSVNNYTLSNASVNCVTQVQTSPITVITSVGFNAESCAVTSETTTVYVVSDVSSGPFSAATYANPPATPTVITQITAATTNITAVSGVSSGTLQAATYTSPPTTPVLVKAVTLSRSTANVADLTGNIRITAIA